MRSAAILLAVVSLAMPLHAQDKAEGPTNEKAQKTYKEAEDFLHQRRPDLALDFFKKADKQDGGHCVACQKKMIKYGTELQEWKTAETAAEEMVAEAQDPKHLALAHYQFGLVLMNEGLDKHKDELALLTSSRKGNDASSDTD